MTWKLAELSVECQHRGSYDITSRIQRTVKEAGIQTGLCHLFIKHTSASLILCENADSVVRDDLERFMSRLVPDGDGIFQHTAEGSDDMPSHIRSILTHSDLTIPVSGGRLALGTWQGVYIWEHRTHLHKRSVVVTVQGE